MAEVTGSVFQVRGWARHDDGHLHRLAEVGPRGRASLYTAAEVELRAVHDYPRVPYSVDLAGREERPETGDELSVSVKILNGAGAPVCTEPPQPAAHRRVQTPRHNRSGGVAPLRTPLEPFCRVILRLVCAVGTARCVWDRHTDAFPADAIESAPAFQGIALKAASRGLGWKEGEQVMENHTSPAEIAEMAHTSTKHVQSHLRSYR